MVANLTTSQVGIYVEISGPALKASQVGTYVEIRGVKVRVYQVGIYVEKSIPYATDVYGPRLQVI